MSKDILILSDGRPGHLNQSLGLVERLPVSFEVCSVKYRTKLCRLLALLLAQFEFKAEKLLKWLLSKESFEGLKRQRPEIIVSTGSYCAPVNILLSNLFSAKKVVCMLPGGLSPEKFDLVILSLHDKVKVKNSENILTLLGAPNRINRDFLEQKARELKQKHSITKSRVIGVFIGGNSGQCELNEEPVRKMITSLKKYALETGSSVLVTSSRRTPEKVEKVLKEELSEWSGCELLLLASESNENPVPGILGSADLIFVTEDSFSMVSEAASAGKPLIVLHVDRKAGKRLKYEEVLNLMKTRRHILRAGSDDLEEIIASIEKSTFKFVPLTDTLKASDRLMQLLTNTEKQGILKNDK